jgi:hypothetical protein
MTLYPGDPIHRHTAGRGQGEAEPGVPEGGDTIRLSIEKLGVQQQSVHAWDPAIIDG